MYEINDNCPTHEDLQLLANIDEKGRYLLEDLYKIFSFRKPKEYKLYVNRPNFHPKGEEKDIMDLIILVQKYNEVLAKKMAQYKEKKKENKDFSIFYEGMKYFNSELCGKEANSSFNLLGNLLSKYEAKHMKFEPKFFKRNIFTQSGLLPYKKKECLDFFDSEVQKNGPNNSKALKSIRFIEKVYEIAEKLSKRLTITNARMKLETQRLLNKHKKTEYLSRLNHYLLQKKEINNDLEDIKNIKELINIANNEYEKILKDLSISKSRSRKKKATLKNKNKNKNKSKSKSRSREKKSIEKDSNINEEKIEPLNKQNTIIIKPNSTMYNANVSNFSRNKEKDNTNKFFKLKKIRSLDRYNKTLSLEAFKGLNLLNIRATASTGFNDFTKTLNLSKHKTFYNPNKNIMNNLSNINIQNNLLNKKNFPTTIFKNISRNNSNNNFFSNKNDNPINLIDNINMNRTMNKTTSNIFQYNKFSNSKLNKDIIKLNLQSNSTKNNKLLLPKMSSPNVLEKEKEKEKENKKEEEAIPKRNNVKRRTNLKRKNYTQNKEKLDKAELFYIRKQKIPAIYEELKSYKNLLSVAKKKNSQSIRIEQLFSELYDRKKIKNINGRKAPKELYNSYYNMSLSIERCHAPETIYRKYKSNMGDSLRKKIGKSQDQDDELKNKYFDFMQMIIKKKIEDENDL